MMSKTVVWACVLLALATSLSAQTRKAPADPISGTWTGELVLASRDRTLPVTLELKFDGKKAVTGTVSGLPNPGDVKEGTFDPKSGSLTLRLGRQSDPAVLLVLEGTVAKGVASGKFTGDESGEFKIAKKK